MSRKRRAVVLEETSDYGRFQLLPFNRDVEKTKFLEASMRQHGWISAYPMHVVKNGSGKLKIKSGHHRFVVARKLGIPVKYVVCDDTATIYELERSTRRWSLNDYLASHVRAGHQEYVRVKKFHASTGIPLTCCISMLGGELAGSSNKTKAFKYGAYQVRDERHANDVAAVALAAANVGAKWSHNHLFIQALSRVLMVDTCDRKRLVQKIAAHSRRMEKHATMVGYMGMIESIYNKKSREHVPLMFLANEIARQRRIATLSGTAE